MDRTDSTRTFAALTAHLTATRPPLATYRETRQRTGETSSDIERAMDRYRAGTFRSYTS